MDTQIVPSKNAYSWTMRYKSVIGFGEVEFIEGIEGKREGMKIILALFREHIRI